VSTWGQVFESQIMALKEYGCCQIYKDKFTGTKMDRVEFQKLLKKLRKMMY